MLYYFRLFSSSRWDSCRLNCSQGTPLCNQTFAKMTKTPAAADSPFDRVIFSFIDAPRLDSVYGGPSGLGFTQKA
jgi:hypothetical protein